MKVLLDILQGIGGCLLLIVCCFFALALGIGISCVLSAWLCDIDPNETYSWYSGIWQGLFCIPNWIRSFFDDSVLVRANYFTLGYKIWWWIVFSLQLLASLSKGLVGLFSMVIVAFLFRYLLLFISYVFAYFF